MKFSVITPTHNPDKLLRAYESLKSQTLKDFEWVLVPNNGAEIPENKFQEPWIRVVSYSGGSLIGAIKNFAFMQGQGEWLVELDHDDELLPNCLEELEKNSLGHDFLYSDCLEVDESNSDRLFGEAFGWSNYEFKNHKVNKTWPATPQSFSKIWYAPNHVRAWRKEFYVELGGHDETLKALDDQELLCRTYIRGKVGQINKPLYRYNLHGNNSCYSEELNSWIQEYTLKLNDHYLEEMMRVWSNKNKLSILDIKDGIPESLEENSMGLVLAYDSLQRFQDPVKTMTEIYRVLAPGGMLLSQTPSTDGRGAFQDPTHRSFWNVNSFWYFTKSEYSKFMNSSIRFQATRILNYYPSEWHKQNNIVYVKADLTALKGDNIRKTIPGEIEI